jgi:hypothetical protein
VLCCLQLYNRQFPLLPVTPILFKNMLRVSRQLLGMGQEGEMSALFDWFAEQSTSHPDTSYAQYVDDRNVCTAVFYMSTEMKSSLRRNGQFIMIDATCKTNRFGMPLIVLAGANEINKCAIFAIGLLMSETILMYKWFLGQCRKAVGQSTISHIDSAVYSLLHSAVYLTVYSCGYLLLSTLVSTALQVMLRGQISAAWPPMGLFVSIRRSRSISPTSLTFAVASTYAPTSRNICCRR